MGTTTEKGDYLNTTKSLLKEKINNLGGNIIDDTIFREYADKLQTIYDNAPKTSYAEGSNITLSNCLKGKLDFEDDKVVYGDTSQESTTGKNLLPNTLTSGTSNGITWTVNSDGTIKVNGTATGNVALYVARGLTLTSGSYILSGCPSGGSNTTYSMVLEGTARDTGNGKTFTGVSNKSVIIEIISGTICNNLLFMPMIETGSTITTYEQYTNRAAPNPSYPFPVQVVTGEQEVVVRGSNVLPLINIDKTILGLHIYSQNGNVYLNGTPSAHIYSTEKLAIFTLKAGTYIGDSTVPRYFLRKTSDDSILNENVRTFTITEDTEVYLCAFISSANTYNNQQMYWQLNKGTTLLGYEPYITPITKTLNLGNIELAEIGTYRDYIYKNLSNGKWIKYNAIIKRTLNGTESINTDNSYIASGRFNINQYTDAKYGSQATPNIMSNYYRPNFAVENSSIFVSGVSPDICIIDTRYQNNLNGFKQYLSENTPIIYYVLATATYTEITDTSLIEQLEDIYNIMSLNGTTKIEINGNLPMIIKVRALKGE